MDEGFIISNKYRRSIFDELASGETDINRISKKHRIISKVALRVVNDFIKGEILEKKGNRYILTEEGEKLATRIRG
jgi:predicted transcriptional regulator